MVTTELVWLGFHSWVNVRKNVMKKNVKSKNFVKLLMEIAEILEIFRIGKIMEVEKLTKLQKLQKFAKVTKTFVKL